MVNEPPTALPLAPSVIVWRPVWRTCSRATTSARVRAVVAVTFWVCPLTTMLAGWKLWRLPAVTECRVEVRSRLIGWVVVVLVVVARAVVVVVVMAVLVVWLGTGVVDPPACAGNVSRLNGIISGAHAAIAMQARALTAVHPLFFISSPTRGEKSDVKENGLRGVAPG